MVLYFNLQDDIMILRLLVGLPVSCILQGLSLCLSIFIAYIHLI